MDKLSEIKNRWFRVFEKKTREEQIEVLKKLDPHLVIQDFKTLDKLVDQLRDHLNAAMNPHSSQVGQVVIWDKGDMKYMLRGIFHKVSDLNKGLELLKKLSKNKRLSKEDKETLKNLLGDDYEEPKKENKDNKPS